MSTTQTCDGFNAVWNATHDWRNQRSERTHANLVEAEFGVVLMPHSDRDPRGGSFDLCDACLSTLHEGLLRVVNPTKYNDGFAVSIDKHSPDGD